jgi:squamous cell carcinoma antigen recognized by T-cells 3
MSFQYVVPSELKALFESYAANEDTFQSYSTFTTNYKAPQAYEILLVNASKIRGKARKAYEWREPYETALVSKHRFALPCMRDHIHKVA